MDYVGFEQEKASVPDPVGACTAVRLPVRYGFTVGHPVDVCAVGRGLNGAVALSDHFDPIHFGALVQFCPVLNVQVLKTKKDNRLNLVLM